MVAGLLGTLKAGKTYVPLDPSYPQERLAHILADSQAGALLTNNKVMALARELTREGCRLINIDSVESSVPTRRSSDPLADITFPRSARSGLSVVHLRLDRPAERSHAKPSQRFAFHWAYTNNLHLSADDRLTLLSSYCFDAAVMDIYGALLNGATLYPIDIKEEGLAGLSEWLSNEEITIYHSTPTVYRYFVNSLAEANGFPRLRLVVLGGKRLTAAT